MNILLTLICVCAIAIGQILFKLAANSLANIPSDKVISAFVFNGYLWLALFIYAGATLGWVWILRSADLHRIYPFMALSFIFVPALSWFFLGERFSSGYIIGIALITIGIIFAVK